MIDESSVKFKGLLVQDLSQALLNSCEIIIKERAPIKYGCHCDLETLINPIPDDCVMDTGNYQDCVYAEHGTKKEDCEYWKPIIIK